MVGWPLRIFARSTNSRRSRRILSTYIHVGNVVRGHDCMDAGGRAKQEARAEESEATW